MTSTHNRRRVCLVSAAAALTLAGEYDAADAVIDACERLDAAQKSLVARRISEAVEAERAEMAAPFVGRQYGGVFS